MEICLLCAKCCEQTEMPLANDDVKNIITQTKLPKQQFAFIQDGYLHLKNKGKFCVFLNSTTRRCSIYENRPIGCRFYPIIYDPYLKKCVVDKDCSNKHNIPSDLIKKKCPELEKFIKKLEKERTDRLTRKD